MNRALCIGINDYPGVDADLAGCVNDADDIASFLSTRGFKVAVLANAQATKSSMIAGIRACLDPLQPGECGVIAYSGHGTWLPDLDGDEADQRDEAWCPYDLGDDWNNLLIDDEMSVLLNDRASGTRIFFLSDSCHSGTVFRLMGRPGVKRKIRYLSPGALTRDLDKLVPIYERPRRKRKPRHLPLNGVVTLSGCDDHEYSSDAEFDGRPNGALTYYFLRSLQAGGAGMTYRSLLHSVRGHLPSWDYPQTPIMFIQEHLQDTPVFS